MARGFWTGLLHGGVLSVGTLLLLSLMVPLPGIEGPETVPAAVGDAPEPEVAEPVAGDVPAGGGDVAPAAAALDLPVGSEFARGGDVAPNLPEPLAAPAARLDQSEAPAVTAPAAEPAPVTVTGDARRPETADQDGPGLAQPDAGESAPVLDRPEAMPAPDLQQAPQMVGQGGQDSAPGRPDVPVAEEPVQVAPVEVETETEEPTEESMVELRAEPEPEPAPAPIPAEQAPAPVLPAPAPDLSLPPDLTDLRSMERN